MAGRATTLRAYLLGQAQHSTQDRRARVNFNQERAQAQGDFRQQGYAFERHQNQQQLHFEHGIGGFGGIEAEPWSADLWEGC